MKGQVISVVLGTVVALVTIIGGTYAFVWQPYHEHVASVGHPATVEMIKEAKEQRKDMVDQLRIIRSKVDAMYYMMRAEIDTQSNGDVSRVTLVDEQ